MITILHNNRCSKSREALKLLDSKTKKYILREYLKNPLDYDELLELKDKLGLKAIEFTRTNEKEFKEANLSKDSSDEDILKAIAIYPKLMQRAIVFDETKAILCRPPENVLNILKK
jgi:arsenate reductase